MTDRSIPQATTTPKLPPRWFIRAAWVVHRAIHRFTGGRRGLAHPKGPGGQFGLLRLKTVGRRSGTERAAILGYVEDGANLVTLAMNGWGEKDPAWWLNLRALPDATVELKGGATRAVHAREATGEERERLWTQLQSLPRLRRPRRVRTAPIADGGRRPRAPAVSANAAGRRSSRLPVVLILLLMAIPLLAGGYRLATLALGADITPENVRFFTSPVPVVLHIVGAAVYIVLGAFQFVPSIRRRNPTWHRRAGRVAVVSGLVAALSALWMTMFYALPASDGALLQAFRLIFGFGMVGSIVLAFLAIRRREIARHRAWMMRGYAIGLGAGTQAMLFLFGELIFGKPDVLARALIMGAAWTLNLAVAEWIIRGRPLWPIRLSRATASAPG